MCVIVIVVYCAQSTELVSLYIGYWTLNNYYYYYYYTMCVVVIVVYNVCYSNSGIQCVL